MNDTYHAISFSGGKDSTAMLLLMIERDLPINTVLWADTGMEFPEMYDHIRKVDDYLYRERGIHITTLRHPKGFEYLMFEKKKQKPASIENRQRLGVPIYGNGWPGVKVRWCTGQLKTHLISKEANRLKGEYQALHYLSFQEDARLLETFSNVKVTRRERLGTPDRISVCFIPHVEMEDQLTQMDALHKGEL